MEDIGYLDFDLQIERTGQGYRVNVLSSPAGQASNDFALPFSDLELENFVLRMSRTRRGARRLGTPELEAARAFGGRLYEAVFAGEVRGCLRSSLDEAAREGRGLRLRLRLTEAPELVDLPWEYLYSPALNRFFALSNATPLVRYLDLPEPVAPLVVQPPLRLLAVIASPRDFPSLDVEQEWQKLRAALKELEDAGRVTLERLEPPTLSALQRRLRNGPCHILHFIGHGAFDESTQDGQLLLEDKDGRGNVISAQDLGVILHDHHSLRLVVLNSCEGARTSRTDPFAGAAQSLVQQGMPAVLAMQFEISDDAAIVISHEFYSALAAGFPVDAALAEARKAAFTSGNSAEWGTPVLYLRAPDARIFGLGAAPLAAGLPVPPKQVPRPAGSPKLLWILGGLLAVLALVFGLTRVLPGAARGPGPAPTGQAPGVGATAGPAAASLTRVSPPVVETGAASQSTPAAGRPSASPMAAALGPRKSIDQLVASNPLVLSSTAGIQDLVAVKDGVWAATTGGLVRWKADGTSQVFTAANGLPFNYMHALLPMPDGSLYVSGNGAVVHVHPTESGLGEIQRYSEAEGVDIGEYPVLLKDADGSVWEASQYASQPALRFDGSLWRPPDIPTDSPVLKDLNPLIISTIRSKDGSLWLGLYRDGILRWDGKSWTRYGAEQGVAEQEKISRLLEDDEGRLWAANGARGLLRFDPAVRAWKKVEFQRADAEIFWISELPDKSLWASGNDFIARSEDGGAHWTLAATPDDNLDHPGAVVEDGAGLIWAATQDGIAMYEDGNWRILHRSGEPDGYELGQILPGPDGKLWVLPEYGGQPSVIDPATGQTSRPPQWPPSAPDVLSLAFSGDLTWAGTSSGLLRLENGSLRALTQPDGLPDNRVGVLLATTDTLWIGTSAGLSRLDIATGKVTGRVDALNGQYVDALTLGRDGALWAGTHWGEGDASSAVYRIAGADVQSWPNDGPPLNGVGHQVQSLAVAEDGAVWAGSNGGVYRWDGQKWSGWDPAQGAPSGDIFAMLPHGGAMWIAGHGGEISRWDPQEGWRRFRSKGLTGDVLDMYVSDDGALWLATGDGLLRYGP